MVLKLKTAWCDGTTHIVTSPHTFMQRPAALAPWHGLHLIRFHGVPAPNATLWAMVVPAVVTQWNCSIADCDPVPEIPLLLPGSKYGHEASSGQHICMQYTFFIKLFDKYKWQA